MKELFGKFTDQLLKDEGNHWRGFSFYYKELDMRWPLECGRGFFSEREAVPGLADSLPQNSRPLDLKLFDLSPWFYLMDKLTQADPGLRIFLVDVNRLNGDRQIAAVGNNGEWEIRPQYEAAFRQTIPGSAEKMRIPTGSSHWH